MKKVFTLLFAIALLSSCEDNLEPIEVTASISITESVAVNIPQTTGTPVSYDETATQDLNQLISNLNSVTAININALSYTYTNVTGNTNAVIQSASVVINGFTVASISNVNIGQEANTAIAITDTAVLDQIEALLLNDPTVIIQFVGTALSDDGSIDFDVEFSVSLTITLQ
ncbi:MAG: hypothetical protein JKY02_11050 [Flavobacteriaceae bacterium]|nr:hypothetical protein [Flavobacteriaceae bacterium]